MGLKKLQKLINGRSQEDDQSREDAGHRHEYSGQPVSPLSQSLRSSSLCIHVVLELEQPMTFTQLYAFVEAILPRNRVLSCIMKEDDRGILRWQKTRVNIDDHILVLDDVDPAWVESYIYKSSHKPVDNSGPLWEFHVLNHKTSETGATMVMRFHHSLGDGISLMSLLFSVVTRVDNPHLPPTFPTSANGKTKAESKPSAKYSTTSTSCSERWSAFTAKLFNMRPCYTMTLGRYILVDVISSFLRVGGWIDDSQLQPIPQASSPDEDQLIAAELSSATFKLEDIKNIKNCVGGTVNDVLTGIILYGMQRYLQIHLLAVGEQISLEDAYEKRNELTQNPVTAKQLKNLRFTALCAINTRSSPGLQKIEDMLKSKSKAAWGNQVFYLPVRIPLSVGKVENDPLEFVKRAKSTLDRRKMTSGLIGRRFMRYVARLKGPQGFSRYVFKTMASTTLGISNMVGPVEKVAIGGNPIKTFSFSVSGGQGLQFFVSGGQGLPPVAVYILSYMGTVVMQIKVQVGYVDPKMLSKCLTEAFNEMKESSIVYKLAD